MNRDRRRTRPRRHVRIVLEAPVIDPRAVDRVIRCAEGYGFRVIPPTRPDPKTAAEDCR